MVAALAAVAGVVVAHAVDYAAVFPQSAHRATRLQATGHAYWPLAAAAALAAGAVAVLLAAGRGAVRAAAGRAGPERAAGGPAWVNLPWLLVWQAAAFTVMEAGERVAAGVPPSVLLHGPELWVGLALQLPVAWLAIRFLGAVERTAFRVTSHLARRPSRPVRHVPATATAEARPCLFLGSRARPRGPPTPAFA